MSQAEVACVAPRSEEGVALLDRVARLYIQPFSQKQRDLYVDKFAAPQAQRPCRPAFPSGRFTSR